MPNGIRNLQLLTNLFLTVRLEIPRPLLKICKGTGQATFPPPCRDVQAKQSITVYFCLLGLFLIKACAVRSVNALLKKVGL